MFVGSNGERKNGRYLILERLVWKDCIGIESYVGVIGVVGKNGFFRLINCWDCVWD